LALSALFPSYFCVFFFLCFFFFFLFFFFSFGFFSLFSSQFFSLARLIVSFNPHRLQRKYPAFEVNAVHLFFFRYSPGNWRSFDRFLYLSFKLFSLDMEFPEVSFSRVPFRCPTSPPFGVNLSLVAFMSLPARIYKAHPLRAFSHFSLPFLEELQFVTLFSVCPLLPLDMVF